jgi:hypothetical protein
VVVPELILIKNAGERIMLRKTEGLNLVSVFMFLMILGATPHQTWAQGTNSNSGTIPLRAEQFKINRLASERSSDQATFNIDSTGLISIEIISNNGAILTSIDTPAGTTITPANINGLGGRFLQTDGTPSSDSFLIIPSQTGNFHYLYSFPAQGSGQYIIHYKAPANLSGEVAIITEATWDSPILATVFPAESRVRTRTAVVLTAALFHGSAAITNASIVVTVVDQAGGKSTLTLLDNGTVGTDNKANDGLYSGLFIPNTVGSYSILATITGTAGGTSFTRNALTQLEAVAPKGQLTNDISDHGVDDDGDGLIDRITLKIGTQINLAGTYQAFVHLRTQTGKTFVGTGIKALANGNAEIEANVTAESIRAVNESGPYTIDLVELDYVDSTQGSEAADERYALGQTAAYLVSQFQRRALILTGAFSEQGVDANSNGKFERLRVAIQVDVLVAGAYDWTLKLSDPGFAQIDVAAGRGQLGTGLQDIVVEFDGLKIGGAGVPGPYLLNDLLLFGPKSLVITEIGRTRVYLPEQFEGGQPSPVSFLLTPQFVINLHIGTNHTLSAALTSNNSPVPSQEVTFRITDGPNVGQRFTAQTNSQGVATVSYTSPAPGTDTIEATFVDSLGRTRVSNLALASWIENITIDLSPLTVTRFITTNSPLTATVLNSNNPVPDVPVVFTVISGPNSGKQFSAQTNALGVASASYVSTIIGTDTIRANVTIGTTVITSNQVSVLWFSNRAPVCSNATPSISLITLPDRRFVSLTVQGVADPDNDALTISINSIRQDEPVDHIGDGRFSPDGMISGPTAQVRAESIIGTVNVGNIQFTGNGRFYHIAYTARDPLGATCTGEVKVGVPHVRTATPVDGGALFDSTSTGATSNLLNNPAERFWIPNHSYDFLGGEPDSDELASWAGMTKKRGAGHAQPHINNRALLDDEFIRSLLFTQHKDYLRSDSGIASRRRWLASESIRSIVFKL